MSTLSTLEANSLKGALEALLLVSSDPVSAPALAGALDIAPGECASLLAELKVEYEEANRGFQLREVAGGWRLFTHPAYHDVVEAYVLSWDTQKLSQAALETLAVIAYHQPVTREVVKGIRGVNSDGVIASLVDKGLVRELGRDPERGQAIIYGTTNAFLEKFGLRSTRDLPDLEQFAPDEQSRQFIRERLSGRSIQSTLEEQAEDLDEERELIDTDVEDTDDAGLLRLTGSIEHVIYANEDNGFAICDLGTESGDLITITGTLPYVGEGDSVTVYGKWVHNPKYGRQFRVETCERQMPADANSMLRYLASGAIKGIGPKIAQRIVDEFGDETFDVIEHHPEWLANVSGISRKSAKSIGADFAEKAGIRSAMMFFRDFFGAAATVRIYKRYGGNAVELAKKNPYRLCEEIEGIGFERADRMARDLGLATDSEDRICSGICYLLSSNAQANGHVCLPRDKTVQGAARLLGVDETAVNDALELLLAREQVHAERLGGIELLYDKKQYENEKYIATKLLLLDRVCPAMETANIGAFIDREQAETGVRYADLQRRAISDALENGVMLLTGGPGTGKTTVVRALLHIFSSMGLKIALTAPTGRAAKRLSESTSCEARTIHRLLEYGGEESGGRGRFMRDESNLLEENVLIVDEASMVDSLLMGALLP